MRSVSQARDMTPAIELRRAGKRYHDVPVVRDVSLSIYAGETVCFIGPSGCGKSTTMKMINRLVDPTDGEVLVHGKDVRSVDISTLRLGMGYVIQDAGLFAHYTIARNAGLVPELLKWPEKRRKARVAELLELVGLPIEKFGGRYPRQLSGGERQRVGIARALAADPPIVLFDEPFSALDPITRERLQDELLELSSKLEKTFVIVTHDIFEAVRLADRLVIMREGRVVQVGTPREVVEKPADRQVTALFGRYRFQLRLMTMSILDAVGEGKMLGCGELAGKKTIEMKRDASAWDALDKMETEGAHFLAMEGGRFVTRDALLGALRD